jgi:hypothetical protein
MYETLASQSVSRVNGGTIPIEEWSSKNPFSLQRDGWQFGYFRFVGGVGISRPIANLGIQADYNGKGSVVYMPYWLLAVLTGALAVAPWIKLSKRFSLRTLLIGITLAAVVLGILTIAE